MRRVINFRINKESTEDMIKAGRFNPSLEITLRDRAGQQTYKLSAGYGDDVEVYCEGDEIFIFYNNEMLGYVGLEVIHGDEKLGGIFMEEDELKDVLGSENLTTFTIIRRLKNYIYSRD